MNESRKDHSRPRLWRVWGTVVIIDSIACGGIIVSLSLIFVKSGAGWAGEEGGVLALMRQPFQDAVVMAAFLCFIKLTVCPQYWVLLLGMYRRRYKLTGGGVVRITATLLRCFLFAYPLAFCIFFVASLGECDSLFDCLGMVARYWYDWDYNLGLAKPSALFSAFVTGPIIAMLFARST